MEIKIHKPLVDAIGLKALAPFGVKKEEFGWRQFTTINLRRLSAKGMQRLTELLEAQGESRAAKILLKDIQTWTSAKTDPGGQKSRTVDGFCDYLTEFIRQIPGHRLFQRSKLDGTWLCSYVTATHFVPEELHRGERKPPYVWMELVHESYGVQHSDRVTFHAKNIRGLKVSEVLLNYGYVAETDQLRAGYLTELERYSRVVPAFGKQFIATGVARLYQDSYGSKIFDMNAGDRINKVIVDTSEVTEDRKVDLRPKFWAMTARERRKEDIEASGTALEDVDEEIYDVTLPDPDETPRERYGYRGDSDDDDSPENADDLTDGQDAIEVPVHPYVEIFDLGRHLDLTCHVNFLTEYIYDTKIAEKLVLPLDEKSLVKMLVEGKGAGFHDIIGGKSGGVIVLLSGKPGTGKTLTAEVYAESEEKPLYSVQASQLGIEIEELEKNLLAVLRRAARWNAVLLIDEADVYVHVRGNDLVQNAIVGVFLRVLEYHTSILFMTTNRVDLVDDAIASRCIARIDYEYPPVGDQIRIWHVLSKTSGIRLAEGAAEEFARKHPDLNGRDVKNLIKLSKLIGDAKGVAEIDVVIMEFALRFKPTANGKLTVALDPATARVGV